MAGKDNLIKAIGRAIFEIEGHAVLLPAHRLNARIKKDLFLEWRCEQRNIGVAAATNHLPLGCVLMPNMPWL